VLAASLARWLGVGLIVFRIYDSDYDADKLIWRCVDITVYRQSFDLSFHSVLP